MFIYIFWFRNNSLHPFNCFFNFRSKFNFFFFQLFVGGEINMFINENDTQTQVSYDN